MASAHRRLPVLIGLTGLLLTPVAVPADPAADPLRVHAFVEAARRGDLASVREALDGGMPPDATLPPRDPRYPYTVHTALEAAAVHPRLEAVELLLERGASLRRNARLGLFAASGGRYTDSPELLALLASRTDASTRSADFGPALIRAAANGAKGEVAYLLSIGVDPDWRSPEEPWDDPAIVRAGRHFEIVDLLLAAGADPSGGELPYRWSLLFPAARARDEERVRLALALGADPELRGRQGNALSLAVCSTPRTVRPTQDVMERTERVAMLLLDAGSDPNVRMDGRTPLLCARQQGHTRLAARLEAAGGRASESLWSRVARGARRTTLWLAVLLGGGM